MIQHASNLDDLDQRIVETLMFDGRISVPSLAEKVGTSRATAYSRFERLIDSGVIGGFHATVDPREMGLTVAALTLVRTKQSAWRDVAKELADVPGVVWLGISAGNFDFVVLIRAESLERLRDSVLEKLLSIDGVDGIDTKVLLEEFGDPLSMRGPNELPVGVKQKQ